MTTTLGDKLLEAAVDAQQTIKLHEETNLRLQKDVTLLREQVTLLQADNSRLFLERQQAEERLTLMLQDEQP